MTTSRTNRLAALAAQMGIDPVAAIALPTVVRVAALKARMTEDAIILECAENAPLRDYLAGICREADVSSALRA